MSLKDITQNLHATLSQEKKRERKRDRERESQRDRESEKTQRHKDKEDREDTKKGIFFPGPGYPKVYVKTIHFYSISLLVYN